MIYNKLNITVVYRFVLRSLGILTCIPRGLYITRPSTSFSANSLVISHSRLLLPGPCVNEAVGKNSYTCGRIVSS